MSEVTFADEKLISTSRAAKLSGYSQDYIGQLCRSGSLECKMISDQWYIDPASLRKYVPDMPDTFAHEHQHEHAETEQKDNHRHTEKEKKAYSLKVADVRSGAFKYDGANYVPTQKAAELTGYTQDYIGQLARSGEVPARKVGRRWFIARDALMQHRSEKDTMLQSVQAGASGILNQEEREQQRESAANEVKINTNFDIKYLDEGNRPLMPSSALVDSISNTSEPSEDAPEHTSTKATGGRFSDLAQPSVAESSANTHLVYTRIANKEKIVPPTKPLIVPTVVPSTNKYRQFSNREVLAGVKSTRSPGSKLLFTAFMLTNVAILVLTALLYLGFVDKSILEPLSPVYNAIQSLEQVYGEYLPGRIINYSN